MTEQPNKEKFKQAIDHTLSGLTGDPFLYQRVAANTEKGAKHVKYHIPKGVVIALIVILCMGTVAVAAGVYGGTINWEGEVVREKQDSYWGMEYALTEAEEKQMQRVNEVAAQLKRDGESLEISVRERERSWMSMRIGIEGTVTDMDAFISKMADVDYMPLPRFIPNGYEFTKGKVLYACCADGAWKLVEKLEYDDGIVAERYRVDEEDLLVWGYSLYFLNSSEDAHLAIQVSLKPRQNGNSPVIGFSEAPAEIRSVTIAGMDDTILLEESSHSLLAMRQELQTSIDILEYQGAEVSLEDAVLIVDAQNVSADILIRMFAAE